MTDDVRRLFDRLVHVIADQAPDLLGEPIPAADLYERYVPYRAHRTSLGFDSNQDYEMAFLRLLSGEQGLADIEHDEARIVLTDEARSVNPHPGAFRRYATAYVRLNRDAAEAMLLRRDAYAPPLPRPEAVAPAAEPPPAPIAAPTRQLPFELESAAPGPARGDLCPHCHEPLPVGRTVKFCPFCGGNATSRACPQCGTALETAWRHCITCGYRIGG